MEIKRCSKSKATKPTHIGTARRTNDGIFGAELGSDWQEKMEDLPEECALEVLARTDAAALRGGLRMASRRMEALTKTPTLWKEKVERDFAMGRMAQKMDGRCVEDMYTSVLQAWNAMGKDGIERVEFEGVFTDGGCDAKNLHYWVGNAFFHALPDCYCSEKGKNVHCVAEMVDLMGGTPAIETRIEYRKHLLNWCQPLIRFIQRQDPEEGDLLVSQVSTWTTERLAAFLRQAFEEFLRGSPIMATILMDIPPEERRDMLLLMRDLVSPACPYLLEQDEREIMFPNGGKNDIMCIKRLLDPPAKLRGLGDGRLSVISKVEVCRHGDFSCPVACGAIFMCGYDYSCPSGSLLEVMQDSVGHGFCHALDDVTSTDHAISLSGKVLPKVEIVRTTEVGDWVEFRSPRRDRDSQRRLQGSLSAGTLEFWPMVWFRFRDRTSISEMESMTRASTSPLDEAQFERFNTLHIPLTEPHVGNLVCVKLIDQENLMSLYLDEHESPNIDLRSVVLHGKSCSFPWQPPSNA
mmetsp:Transcript_4836/g.30745  ORF Transcript_4836/g.30745 Transcript_4836/m.30745 type:complete len:521 (+) Transcript_4836:13-1575(+)